MQTKHPYINFITETNLAGSGKASSYIRALDLLGEMLALDSLGFSRGTNVWSITREGAVDDLLALVKQQQAKAGNSVWLSSGIAPSYLTKGYCHAALNSYKQFLLVYNQEAHLLDVFKGFDGDGKSLAQQLASEPDRLAGIAAWLEKNKLGEEVLKAVKTRLNQRVFRQMLQHIYQHRCCITGLKVAALNRASHIVPWAKNEHARLDPSNGLYLSATYDAAFDKHLITLDQDYRLVLSHTLKAQAADAALHEYFIQKEGQRIHLPKAYLPEQSYLEQHRSLCDV